MPGKTIFKTHVEDAEPVPGLEVRSSTQNLKWVFYQECSKSLLDSDNAAKTTLDVLGKHEHSQGWWIMVNIYHDPVHFKLAMSGKGRIQMTDKEKDEEVVKMLLLVAGDIETNPGPMVSVSSENV